MEPPASYSRKQKRKEEAALLLREARRSQPDDAGRVRCLSCGAVFAHHQALTSHLTKHGGINALDYTPSNIVATSKGSYRREPIERPTWLLTDAVVDATRKPKKEQQNAASGQIPELKEQGSSTGDNKGKRHKVTPTKRSILIQQVLSLNQKLAACRNRLEMLKTPTDPSPPDAEIKKEMKTLQGCINASETELQMALTTINRKFTFRQLVMIEFLTCQLEEWILSTKRSPDPPSVDTVDEANADDDDLRLYDDAEILWNQMESVRETSTRSISARRDPETGKLFIPKPSFAEGTIPTKESTEMTEIPDRQIVNEAKGEATDIVRCDDDDESSVGGTSSDDDMWGFSNVLVEWANAVKRNTQQSYPSVPQPGDISFEWESEEAMVSGDGDPTEEATDFDAVRVVHVGQKLKDRSGGGFSVDGDPSEPRSFGDFGDGGVRHRCVFIKPHLVIPEDESDRSMSSGESKRKNNDKREKTSSTTRQEETESVVRSTIEPKNLDEAVHGLLSRLNDKQHEHMKSTKDGRRWMVNGLSEVGKHLARGTVRLLIVARNLDAAVHSKVSEIESVAKDIDVPVVYALTRRKIGRIYHPQKRMSIVAVLDIHDMEEIFSIVVRMGQAQS